MLRTRFLLDASLASLRVLVLLALSGFASPTALVSAQTAQVGSAAPADSAGIFGATVVTCTPCTKPGPGTQPVKLHCPWAYGELWWAGSANCDHGFCPGIGDHCETSHFRGTYPDGWAYDFNWTVAQDCGRTILAAAGGTVTLIGYDTSGWGKFVVIDHGSPGGIHTITRYHHLESIGDNIDGGTEPGLNTSRNPSVHIRAGDYVGANGGTSGTPTPWQCHLHFVVDVQNSGGSWTSVDPDAMDGQNVACGAQLRSSNSVDQTAPAVNFTGPVAGRWYMVDQRLDWTVTDTQSNVRGFGQAWDGVPPNNSFPYATSGFLMVSWVGQGQHTAHVNAEDISWNAADRAYGWIGYDVSAPTVVRTAGAAPGSYTTDQTIVFNASDLYSGVRGYSVGWDDPNVAGPAVLAASGSTALSSMPGGSGAHTLFVRAWDNARDGSGNIVGNSAAVNLGLYTYTITTGPCGPPLPNCGTAPQVASAMAPEVLRAAMDADVATPTELTSKQWQDVGQPAEGLLQPQRLYRIGFEYRSAESNQLRLGLGTFDRAKGLRQILDEVDVVPSADRWRPFWSAPFAVTAEQLRKFGNLRFELDQTRISGVEIRNVRIWSPLARAGEGASTH